MTSLAVDRPVDVPVLIPSYKAMLEADWSVPERPRGVVLVANAGNGSRFTRKTRRLARVLYEAGFATLIHDLLTPDEEIEDSLTGAIRLDIDLLAQRIVAGRTWIREQEATAGLPVGCLASGVASAGALVAAARTPGLFSAVVSKHGRPDLAGVRLHKVKTPTLLMIGEDDQRCRELNRWALRRLDCEKSIETVQGASHHFEDIEALDRAGAISAAWFRRFTVPQHTGLKSMFTLNWTERRLTMGSVRI